MKYRLLLTNRRTGDEAEVIVPARLSLEELSIKIKLEMNLPLTDWCCHRFAFHGVTYVPYWNYLSEQEMRYESNLYVGRYRSSDRVSLSRVFTVLGSAVTYYQDTSWMNHYKVRVTLLERID